jgi:hypothetical protein
MRTLIWKELRENLKWVLPAIVLFGGALLYGLYHNPENYSPGYYISTNGITLCRPAYLLVTTFGCAIIGFGLGLVQILPELGRDRWAALLHRPAPRGVIFAGKAAGGLLLYGIAVLPPILLCTWLAATPGHFPVPFVAGMMKPEVVDVCLGAVYYFAALALTLQREMWVVLRAFPLMAAFHCSFVANAAPEFGDALGWAIFLGAALMAAAWGLMVQPGRSGERPWVGRVAFVVMVLFGAEGFGDITTSIIEKLGPQKHSDFHEYMLTDEGTPLAAEYKDNVCVSLTDVNGKKPANPDWQPSRIRNHMKYSNGLSLAVGDVHGWKRTEYREDYRGFYRYLEPFEAPVNDSQEHAAVQWFQLQKANSLIGVSFKTKAPVARFDAEGFKPLSADPHPFLPGTMLYGGNYREPLVLWNGKAFYVINLGKREMNEVPLPGDGPVYGMIGEFAEDETGSSQVIAVALRDRMAIYGMDGTLITTLPYHHDVHQWGQIDVGVTGGLKRYTMWYQPSEWIDAKTKQSMNGYVEEVDATGNVLRSWTLPPLPPNTRSHTFGYGLADHFRAPALFFAVLGSEKLGAMLGNPDLRKNFEAVMGSHLEEKPGLAAWICAISGCMAAGCYLWARKASLPAGEAAGWAAFVFLFNLAGLITFRLAAEWPRTVVCPRCGALRRLDGERCAACGEGWPAPEPVGIEIFDGMATAES